MIPRGADPLIALRKAGKSPVGSVFVEYGDDVREPDWHRWPDTMHRPYIVVRFADPVERIDLRCTLGLSVTLILCRYDDKGAALFSRLQEYASEVCMMSPDFGEDIGFWWMPKYGVRPFDDRSIITGYEAARSDCVSAALRHDTTAYNAAQVKELQLIKENSWLTC